MKNNQPENVLAWLRAKPPLDELAAAYPELREEVRKELAGLIATENAAGIPAYLKRLMQHERLLEKKCQSGRGNTRASHEYLQQVVKTRMAHLAVKQHLIAEATGVKQGKVRFNRWNGFLAHLLLFRDGLERKPVNLFWFRLLWPLVTQRRILMPLVQPEGIYCFYSQQLIQELRGLIAGRRCLEIAAGDGTLSSFLTAAGVDIVPTDDYSWQHEVKYSAGVEKLDAQEALKKYAPEVVICSWPPAGNSFEQQVFRSKSVQLYVVIGSRHRIAAGNRESYEEQSAFEFCEDERLSSLVLPPELDSAVFLFRRKDSMGQG